MDGIRAVVCTDHAPLEYIRTPGACVTVFRRCLIDPVSPPPPLSAAPPHASNPDDELAISLTDDEREPAHLQPMELVLVSSPLRAREGRRSVPLPPPVEHGDLQQGFPTKWKWLNLPMGTPFEIVATDLLGPQPQTKARNHHILIFIDHHTRLVELFALPNPTAALVAAALFDTWISRWEVPRAILSDNCLKQLCATFNINMPFAAPYHPRGNCIVESYMRFLKPTFRPSFHSFRRASDVVWLHASWLCKLTVLRAHQRIADKNRKLLQGHPHGLKEGMLVALRLTPKECQERGIFSPGFRGPFVVKSLRPCGLTAELFDPVSGTEVFADVAHLVDAPRRSNLTPTAWREGSCGGGFPTLLQFWLCGARCARQLRRPAAPCTELLEAPLGVAKGVAVVGRRPRCIAISLGGAPEPKARVDVGRRAQRRPRRRPDILKLKKAKLELLATARYYARQSRGGLVGRLWSKMSEDVSAFSYGCGALGRRLLRVGARDGRTRLESPRALRAAPLGLRNWQVVSVRPQKPPAAAALGAHRSPMLSLARRRAPKAPLLWEYSCSVWCGAAALGVYVLPTSWGRAVAPMADLPGAAP
ncbi:hypothetical protein Efla_005182 [Eimeria flavescens]